MCKFGDSVINQKTAGIYQKKVKGKPIERGVAFPTCISVNECVCHNCPLESDQDRQLLRDGDLVKADVGCYIDGYMSVAAHSFIVGSQPTVQYPLTGVRADVMMAAHVASEVAVKLMQPGNTNSQVTQAISKVAEAYGVFTVAGVLSHKLKRFVIDGNKAIAMCDDAEHKVETHTFELNEAYAVDIVMSSGDGRLKEAEARATIFKRAVDKSYRLKMRASRYLFNEVNARFPALPFTLRSFNDERQARMGIVECLKHELLQAYPVLYAKQGDYVVQFKFTVLILPSGPTRITGVTCDLDGVQSEKTVNAEVNVILAQSTKKKKRRPRKKPNARSSVRGVAPS
mmetsp:Transcript_7509/g.24787  ORF Transcript_7509/g.24787 Transcript_7509/m.24787 type:complete len:342 (+) Transcript_7509:251-1276(+)